MNEDIKHNQKNGCSFYKLFLLFLMIVSLIVLISVLGPTIGIAGIIFIGYLIVRYYLGEMKNK